MSKARSLRSLRLKKRVAGILCLALSAQFHIFADENRQDSPSAVAEEAITADSVVVDRAKIAEEMTVVPLPTDSLAEAKADTVPAGFDKRRIFNPNPTRAVWLSALCPGLGQIYNRRYWKVPIVVGGYVGLAYATSWNNRMPSDYTRSYRDIMDSDPNTKSYMDFYPSTTKEEDIDMAWLQRALKSKKDFYRRNRDLCIIGMVGLYLVCMVDAYVDASLSHFDITPNLSMQIAPAVIESRQSAGNSFGVNCAFTF